MTTSNIADATSGTSSSSIYQNNNDLIDDVSSVKLNEQKKLQTSNDAKYYFSNKNNHGKKVPVKILGFGDSESDNNHQFAFLNLPDGVLIPNNKKNILRIQVLEQDDNEEDSGFNKIENYRVSKSRRLLNDSKPRKRGSRDNINAEETVRQNVSRRRVTSKLYTVENKDLNETSSTEDLIITLKPTINSMTLTTASVINRGFFVTKNIDEITMNTMTPTTIVSLNLSTNFVTTEIPYTSESIINDESIFTTMTNKFDDLTTEKPSARSTLESSDGIKTTNFAETDEVTIPSRRDQVTDVPLSTLMKYFDETTITSSSSQENNVIISSEKSTEFPTDESLEKLSSITTEKNNHAEDKTTMIFETTVMPSSKFTNEEMSIIKTTELSSNADNELNSLHFDQSKIEKNTEIPMTTESTEMTTSSASTMLVTNKIDASTTTEKNKIKILIDNKEEEPITTESNSSTSIHIEATSTTEQSQINIGSRSRSRGRVRFQETPKIKDTSRLQRPSSRQSFRQRSSLLKTPSNTNQTIEIPVLIQESSPIKQVNNSTKKISFHKKRRNSTSRSRVQTSSTTMQSFTTDIPQIKLDINNITKNKEDNVPIDDQNIAESSFSEAIQEVSFVK